MAWEKANKPIYLGGPGIHNLEIMRQAVQMIWLWIEKIRPNRPWVDLDMHVHHKTRSMFVVSVVTSVGNGENTLFWSDHWMHGRSLEELAPEIYKLPHKNKKA